LNLQIKFGDHDAGGPFGKNLLQLLNEEEIQEIEAQNVAQVMDMENDDNALGQVYTNLKPDARH
jgi:hypothetical protein